MALRTWRALRDPTLTFTSGASWCAAWVLLICAAFGVVLEGPMGAVVFWTILGLANATFLRATNALPAGDPETETDPHLRNSAATREVSAVS
jgi:hypothetical protein